MSTKGWKRSLLGAAAAVLAAGCGGPAADGEEWVRGMEAFRQGVSRQAVEIQLDEQGGDGDGGPAVACTLVVYQPSLAWVTYSYQVRGYAYVSCPTRVSTIQLTVGVEDSDELIRLNKVRCRNTALCATGVNALYPLGAWRTVAGASAYAWGDTRESDWVSF